MILVTVGMHHQGFERLVKAMDSVARRTGEETMMQIGASTYEPRYASWFRFSAQDRVDELCDRARAVVGHAGAGTVIAAIRHRRPLVIVPRRLAHREHVDDHQVELAQALSEAGSAVMVEPPSPDALLEAIEAAVALEPPARGPSSLVEAVAATLDGRWERR